MSERSELQHHGAWLAAQRRGGHWCTTRRHPARFAHGDGGPVSAALSLDCSYVPPADGGGNGRFEVRLVNAGATALRGFHLALTSVLQLEPVPHSLTRLVRLVSGYT